MQVIRTIEEVNQLVANKQTEQQTIGFVPTMGFLHEGHFALVKEAKAEADCVILSIFVNPLQFGVNEDFNEYPRNEDNDLSLAREHGVDYVFIPTIEEMYPKPTGISMTVNQRVGVLCDRQRPGHFSGVLTVLTKLFNLIQPNYSYFGLKDAQQVAIVDLLINELNFPLQLRMIPTVREADGLAKSSRNVNLSSEERAEARFLYQALTRAKQEVTAGERATDKLRAELERYLQQHVSGKIDYIDILTFPDLLPIDVLDGQVIIALAVQFKRVRLIDNISLNVSGEEVNKCFGR